MSKSEEIPSRRIKDIPRHQRRLDTLSRIFEGGSKDCMAVCLVDQTLIIADNKIHAGTTDSAKKLNLIRTTLDHFAKLTNENYDKDKDFKIFQDLCLKRLKGEERGYIKLDTPELEKIIAHVSNNKETNFDDQFIHNKELFTKEKRPYIAGAIEITRNFKTDYNKITGLMLNENLAQEMQPLINAIKGGRKELVQLAGNVSINNNLRNQGYVQKVNDNGSITPGYVILTYDNKNVHAETRLIAYLMLTGALEKNKDLYIGISKQCCRGCNKFITAVNELYGTELKVRGSHDLIPEWTQPAILSYKGSIPAKIISSLRESCPPLARVTTQKPLKVHQTAYSPSSGDDGSPLVPNQIKINYHKRLNLNSLLKTAQDGHLTLTDLNALEDIVRIALEKMRHEVGNKRPSLGSQPKKNLNPDFNETADREENPSKKPKIEPTNDTSWWDDRQCKMHY